jgi:hypothetical protein
MDPLFFATPPSAITLSISFNGTGFKKSKKTLKKIKKHEIRHL